MYVFFLGNFEYSFLFFDFWIGFAHFNLFLFFWWFFWLQQLSRIIFDFNFLDIKLNLFLYIIVFVRFGDVSRCASKINSEFRFFIRFPHFLKFVFSFLLWRIQKIRVFFFPPQTRPCLAQKISYTYFTGILPKDVFYLVKNKFVCSEFFLEKMYARMLKNYENKCTK